MDLRKIAMESNDQSEPPRGVTARETLGGLADGLSDLSATPPVGAASGPSTDGESHLNRKLPYLQVAENRHGWFVIGLDPDDEYGLTFALIGGPHDSREAARTYLREVRQWEY